MSAVPSTELAPEAAAAARAADLYTRHGQRIFSYCVYQLGDRHDAEDAVQGTFLQALRALARGIVPIAEVPWLLKIANNVCLTQRRSRSRRARVESTRDLHAVEQFLPTQARDDDELFHLDTALANLPERERRAILLREWQGLSYREVAEEL